MCRKRELCEELCTKTNMVSPFLLPRTRWINKKPHVRYTRPGSFWTPPLSSFFSVSMCHSTATTPKPSLSIIPWRRQKESRFFFYLHYLFVCFFVFFGGEGVALPHSYLHPTTPSRTTFSYHQIFFVVDYILSPMSVQMYTTTEKLIKQNSAVTFGGGGVVKIKWGRFHLMTTASRNSNNKTKKYLRYPGRSS